MRRLFFILLWVSALAGATPADPPPPAAVSPELEGLPAPLAAALHKLMVDDDHWAYTQTTQVYDRKGRPLCCSSVHCASSGCDGS